MSRQVFRARDKKVQKMTRDGLAEKNLTTGAEKQISKRTADVSFGQEKIKEQEAGHRAGRRSHRSALKKGTHESDERVRELVRDDWGEESLKEETGQRINENSADMFFGQEKKKGHGTGQRMRSLACNAMQEPRRRSVSMRGVDTTPKGKNQPREAARRFAKERAGKNAWQDKETASDETTVPDVPERERSFDSDRKKTEDTDTAKRQSARKRRKRQSAKFVADRKEAEKTERLHYEKSEIPPEERAKEKEAERPHREKQYKKAERRVETAEKKLEKAKKKIPTRTYIRWYKKFNGESGEARHRLHFETEAVPEHAKLSFADRAGRAVGHTASTEAVFRAHQKIREVEADNVGVEASHKTEAVLERGADWATRHRRQRLREKPYREVKKAQGRLAQAKADFAYQKILAENPELEKKVFAKWIQKKKLRKKYAAAAREAAKEIRHTTNVINATGQTVRALAQAAVSRKAVLGAVGIGVLLMAMFSVMLTSCSAMLSGVQSAIIATCYVADDPEINQSELKYTELETDLQININRTEETYPDYDEYRYQIGEIGHNPFELMGYLSAVYDDFTYAQVEAEINRLFGEQYRLIREEITETRTYTDEEGEEQEYEWHVLKTTLTVRPLGDIIAGSLAPGDQTDRYGVYMQTCGNRQCYGNPFDFAWISFVTSPYGYRVHPITGTKDLHRGVDIGAAEGTSIKAVQDGTVVSSGNTGDYGLCVVIEGADGYRSRYAHCSSLSVSAGQEVKRGDVVAAVGSTGSSTGPHLHLEVTHNGEYLNPYYYVAGGGEGYLPGGGAAGSPDFPQDPGAAMGDGSFAAMLAEAEKYLGYPYVWGGSSPSTSFDCSGYVSWVINHSGVGNVGRQTAQGLYNLCTPVAKENMQPGDLVFFTGTYSAATPVTHVGIYVGNGRMIHCGDPISYANLTGYWSAHFYSGGRLP